jgi:hypothetical protein
MNMLYGNGHRNMDRDKDACTPTDTVPDIGMVTDTDMNADMGTGIGPVLKNPMIQSL